MAVEELTVAVQAMLAFNQEGGEVDGVARAEPVFTQISCAEMNIFGVVPALERIVGRRSVESELNGSIVSLLD